MKFCYLDETGTGQDTVVILVGIIVDIQRMNRTKQEWQGLFDGIASVAKKDIKEIHAKDLFSGNDAWRGVDAGVRDRVVDLVLDWLIERNHKVTFSAIDRGCFKTSADQRRTVLVDEWCAAALHIMLGIQKAHQGHEKNKGHTLFIFDKGKDPSRIISLVQEPPGWSDTYYDREKKQERLDQLIDVPFFADSENVPLIQIADLIGYILRRWADLNDYGQSEKYAGERGKFKKWVAKIQQVCLKSSYRYVKRGGCDTAKFYNELAPASLREL
ncbi:MAG: DUF3800 domain-containing protein [Anaerolineae bacterium]|nr:DUF3800 domain-containing protein [Anaerolineae bacterium]